MNFTSYHFGKSGNNNNNKVVLEQRVSPEHTSKYVDTVTVFAKLEPQVIDP